MTLEEKRKVKQAAATFVVHAERLPGGGWELETQRGETRRFDLLVVANGHHWDPRTADFPGEFTGETIHSHHYIDPWTPLHLMDKRILVVGGGDSAVEAAMGLANQPGNKVTLSYRKDVFLRLKDRNDKRVREYMRKGKLQVVFNSQPLEIRAGSVVLGVQGGQREVPNDLVWVFAGGTPPKAFMEKIGLSCGSRALEGAREVA